MTTNRDRHGMRWGVVFAGLLLAGGCTQAAAGVGRVTGSLGEEDGGDAAIAPSCDLTKPFTSPHVVPGLDFATREVFSARLSADETSATLAVTNGAGGVDLFFATRSSTSDPFVLGDPITELNTAEGEFWPTLSADGKMIFFEAARPDFDAGTGVAVPRIWTATRPSLDAGFGPPTVLGIFRIPGGPEASPYLHPSGRSLYFTSYARGEHTGGIFVADLTDFGVATGVRPIDVANSSVEDTIPLASDDERALFFARSGGGSKRDIWVVGRPTTMAPFGVAQEVVEVNSSYDQFPSSISPDGCRLYFVSNRPVEATERYRIWVADKPAL